MKEELRTRWGNACDLEELTFVGQSKFRRMNDEKDLRNRAKHFALRVLRMYSALPKTTEAQILGKQLLRSATSVGANYREAYRGRSKAEWSERDERHAR